MPERGRQETTQARGEIVKFKIQELPLLRNAVETYTEGLGLRRLFTSLRSPSNTLCEVTPAPCRCDTPSQPGAMSSQKNLGIFMQVRMFFASWRRCMGSSALVLADPKVLLGMRKSAAVVPDPFPFPPPQLCGSAPYLPVADPDSAVPY